MAQLGEQVTGEGGRGGGGRSQNETNAGINQHYSALEQSFRRSYLLEFTSQGKLPLKVATPHYVYVQARSHIVNNAVYLQHVCMLRVYQVCGAKPPFPSPSNFQVTYLLATQTTPPNGYVPDHASNSLSRLHSRIGTEISLHFPFFFLSFFLFFLPIN